jgi:hypothetical protein
LIFKENERGSQHSSFSFFSTGQEKFAFIKPSPFHSKLNPALLSQIIKNPSSLADFARAFA